MDWIRQQIPESDRDRLIETLIDWCEINSGSTHLSGLEKMHDRLEEEFSQLAETCESIPLDPCDKFDENGEPFQLELGRALRLRCRPDAPVQILFNGHYDTVYDADHPFQNCEILDDGNTLRGPGAADMKGGLLVMREAIRILEAFPKKHSVGWEILINPEEEIGTPGARDLLLEAAGRNHFGLIFECSTRKGELVHRRLGTGFFRAEVHGKTAHAGRDFAEGKNALEALSDLILRFRKFYQQSDDVIINTARVHGAAPLNAVPDRAVAQFNIRVPDSETGEKVNHEIFDIIGKVEKEHGVQIDWRGQFDRPARVPGQQIAAMEKALENCFSDLNQPFGWRDTGGGTDGSLLLDYGLPNIDSLGVRGDFLHSQRECIAIDSIAERIQLTALFLTRVASGEIDSSDFS